MGNVRLISNAQQKSLNTDIFVNAIPMEPCPSTAHFIVAPLFRCCIKKSGEIGQGDSQPTPVGQIDPHEFLTKTHRLSQRIHAMAFQ